MRTKQKLAYAVGVLFALLFLVSINIALPTTFKVTYAADGKPVSDAFVVSYLAVRGGFHNFDAGQSLSRVTKTDAKGEAHFALDFTWIFLNSFQDYNSRILVYKPFYAPTIVMDAFTMRRPIVTMASPKVQEFSITPHSSDLAKKASDISHFGFELNRIRTEKNFHSGLDQAFEIEYKQFFP